MIVGLRKGRTADPNDEGPRYVFRNLKPEVAHELDSILSPPILG